MAHPEESPSRVLDDIAAAKALSHLPTWILSPGMLPELDDEIRELALVGYFWSVIIAARIYRSATHEGTFRFEELAAITGEGGQLASTFEGSGRLGDLIAANFERAGYYVALEQNTFAEGGLVCGVTIAPSAQR